MSPDNTSSITWQKIAIIIAMLTVALPATGRFAWQVIFPANYLLYEVSPAIQVGEFLAGGVVVVNAGNAPQKDVGLYLPSPSINPDSTKVEVSAARGSHLRSLFEAEPKVSLKKYSQESGSKIPLGTINPGEEVRVTFVANRSGGGVPPVLSLSDARVESSSMIAIEANGSRRPTFHQDWHSFYTDVAPYLLALLLALLAVIVTVGFIHDVFFDTPRKRISRLWRQMDSLQAEIDRESRYQ